jgi:hypothetical protein
MAGRLSFHLIGLNDLIIPTSGMIMYFVCPSYQGGDTIPKHIFGNMVKMNYAQVIDHWRGGGELDMWFVIPLTPPSSIYSYVFTVDKDNKRAQYHQHTFCVGIMNA